MFIKIAHEKTRSVLQQLPLESKVLKTPDKYELSSVFPHLWLYLWLNQTTCVVDFHPRVSQSFSPSASVCRKDLTQQAWNHYPWKSLAFLRKAGLQLMLGNLDFKGSSLPYLRVAICAQIVQTMRFMLFFIWEYGILVCARHMSTWPSPVKALGTQPLMSFSSRRFTGVMIVCWKEWVQPVCLHCEKPGFLWTLPHASFLTADSAFYFSPL